MNNFDVNNEYLIGVSGGPDSMFLLSWLLKQKPKKIVVCHVNYNFRKDSHLDQKIVEDFCREHNLVLEIKTIDPKFYQNLKLNFEAWAREQRYDFFVEIGKKYQINHVLIAHNQNDVVETYLMQLQRQNLIQYWGIKPISSYKKMLVVRPILDFKKSEILKILNDQKIAYVFDLTNFDEKYQRNKIRKNLAEKDFAKYIKQIFEANQVLEQEIKQANIYLEKNLFDQELALDQQLKKMTSEMIQRIVYQYFEKINKTDLLQGRKKQTLVEISKRLKTANKVFWKIELNEFVLMKDFNRLYLLHKDLIKPKTIIINNKNEFAFVQEFNNGLELLKTIKSDGEYYPYIITNDFEKYKTITTYKNKKMNRYLIDEKISYKKRFLKAIVYQKKDLKVLNNFNQ
ncbi:tRNA(Ile)-lysidine synthase [Williamsoniiplasma lucivorax]|uniref:tRNA(Ile)-lysidine synthase n=2 Tax=Williamsoniiplasma lucivorax TaxID=209274 RepID=A0A2S5REZ6_9MOLU|nr:tRNA(Ile)-lysidine synthase [Williamsoniiplasma lucivorax]